MSTTIPIQELDASISPPSDRTIHAVVTLLWPYSSSTRQCALLLSERDFRLRARGGQIRVKFSGPAARAVAEGRLGIGDEVVLELGSGEWVRDEGGVPVRVPGKSVGELQFGRGVSLTVKKNGLDHVKVSIAEDAVDEVEEEEEVPQVQATPRQSANFRASFGGSPSSAAIYSSPAYMRKAAKYSYLDGISRLFEDDWDNQDMPRKKARTSIGDVRSWKMVDRTPSPERPFSGVRVQEDQEMVEVDTVEDADGDIDDAPAAESIASQVPPVATPPPIEQEPGTSAPREAVDTQANAQDVLANPDLENQNPVSLSANSASSALPKLQLPPASPTPQPDQVEIAAAPTVDPVTPRLAPLSSTTLPSTTPQISPLATKSAFGGQADAGLLGNGHGTFQVAEIPESRAEVEETDPESPKPIMNDLPEQDQPTVTEYDFKQDHPTATEDEFTTKPIDHATATEPITLEESENEDPPGPWKSDDLAEEDAFSDDEADEMLSADEKDDEMVYEDDVEDVFDADGLEGEEPSDDETTEDPEMYQSPPGNQQRLEESIVEDDSDVEEQAGVQSQVQSDIVTQPTGSTSEREIKSQPGFAPASTLLRNKDTRVFNANSTIATEQPSVTTPFKKPIFSVDGALPSTEVSTPAARTVGTPNKTPQSAHDKVMKRTFSSLFGIKGTPSPEKEDANIFGNESNGAEELERQVDEPINEPNSSKAGIFPNHRNLNLGLDGQSEVPETHSLDNAPPITRLIDQASLQDDHDTSEDDETSPVAVREMSERLENDGIPDASPKDPIPAGSPPAELINLDSDSEEESKVEEIVTEQAPGGQDALFPISASTVDEHSEEDPNVTLVQEDSVDITMPESVLVDAEQTSSEHHASEQQQPPSEEHLEEEQEEEVPALNDIDHDVTSLRASETPEPANTGLKTVVPDSLEQPASSPHVTLSPQLEVQDLSPVEPERITQTLPEQLQTFDSLEDVAELAKGPDTQLNGHETLLEIPDSAQPSLPEQEQGLRSASPTPKSIPKVEDDSQTNLVEVDDVDMLDAQEREYKSPSSSFESQVVQDSVVAQDGVDAQQQEPESPHFSFESQVVQDSNDAHMFDLHEHSSRPASRDTVEDFSPVHLGSFSQRMSGLDGETQAKERQEEPELDDDAMLEQTKPEESGAIAASLSIDAEQPPVQQDANTPSRVTNRSAIVELESSPSSFGEFSPAKIGQSTHEQVLIPRATFPEEEQESDHEADETLIEQQLNSELLEDPISIDTRPLEEQPSAERMEQYRALDGTDELTSRQDEFVESTKEVPAYPSVPMSPSATQLLSGEPDAPLSHASVGKAVVEPTSLTLPSQPESSLQSSFDVETTKTPEEASNMSQNQQSKQEQTDMPPPEQPAPPKTPARKSLRSRLSNVPDVISAWFSPKRSSITAQEAERPTGVELPAASTADPINNGSARKKNAGGIATAHSYFTNLASLEKRLNPSGEQTGAVDVLAIVADSTKEPVRAKGGPRDYYTVFKITDSSIPTSSPVRVEVFRPWKAVLPAADVGDVVLLRGFVVKSRKRQPYLLSTDSSAWCVWRFAEHNDNDVGVIDKEAEKSVRSRRMSHVDVREEVKGPPVEYGFAEKEEARKLRDWWIETHDDDSQVGASEKAVEKAQSVEAEAIES